MVNIYETGEQAVEMSLYYIGFENLEEREERLKEILDDNQNNSQNRVFREFSIFCPKGNKRQLRIHESKEGYKLYIEEIHSSLLRRI